MVKFITKSVCMALIAMLCVGSLNAQMARTKATGTQIQSSSQFASMNAFKKGISSPTPRGLVKVTLESNDPWTDGSGYQLLLDATATQYDVGFPATANPWASCPVPSTLYNWATHKIPENATAECSHATFVHGSVTVYIPAGTYDFCFTNLELGWGDDRLWFPSTYGPFDPRQDNFVFEEGNAYHFLAHLVGSNDGITLTVTPDVIIECDPATNLTVAYTSDCEANLTWTAPASDLTYNIYRDNIKITTVTTTSYTDAGFNITVPHTWSVKVVCDDFESEAVTQSLNACDDSGDCSAATITAVTNSGTDGLKVDWTYPTKRDDVIITQGGDFGNNGVGAGQSSFGVYHRFTPDDLAIVNGGEITHVAFAPMYGSTQTEPGHTYSIRIYKGGTWTPTRNPGTQIHSQDIDNANIPFDGNEYTVTLTTPIIINASEELWIGYYCTNITSVPDENKFPAGTDNGPRNEGLGNVMFFNNAWSTLYELAPTLNYNWCIKGFVQVEMPTVDIYRNTVVIESGFKGNTYTDKPLEDGEYCYQLMVNCVGGGNSAMSNEMCGEIDVPCPNVTGTKAVIEECKTATITWTAAAGAKEYKIEREGVAPVTVETSPYVEEAEFEHDVTYTWTITTICLSGKEADGVIAETKGNCPGDGIAELANSVAIYPNPTTGMITITADNFTFAKVEIYNTVGQLVDTKTVNKFDISSYSTGVYLFKVYDEYNNSVTKRVMVTK